MSNKELRFAPLIRVSTEKQGNKGESLETQKKQIIKAVEYLGGVIPDDCWKYSGQEHATADQERKYMDMLLEDSEKGIFDAVIVAEYTRWSRDNRKSDEAVDIFRRNGIKLFINTSEYDLEDSDVRTILTVQTAFAGNLALKTIESSIKNRIEKALRNIPTAGFKPYGRIFENGKWEIDEESGKQKIIECIAERYINGEKGVEALAFENNMRHSTLQEILMGRCGDEWKVRFNVPRKIIKELGLKSCSGEDLPIHRMIVEESDDPKKRKLTVEIVHKIPPLLPPETIAAIKQRAQKNKSATHSPRRKTPHLLSGMIKCGHCGASLSGQPDGKRTKRRYEHINNKGSRPCPHLGKWNVRADVIDEAVMLEIFSLHGDKVALEKALHRAAPNTNEVEGLKDLVTAYEKELKTIKMKKDRLLDAIETRTIEENDVRKRMEGHKYREQFLKDEIEKISKQIVNKPTRKVISDFARRVRENANKNYFKSYKALQAMTFKEKKELLAMYLSGKDDEGKPYGVYIFNGGAVKRSYAIRGALSAKKRSRLPMQEYEKESLIEGYGAEPIHDELNGDLIEEYKAAQDNGTKTARWRPPGRRA